MHSAVDPGCNETAQLIFLRSNHGLYRLRRNSWQCGDARVMDVLLGIMHRSRNSGGIYIPICPSKSVILFSFTNGLNKKSILGPISALVP